jgi:catechol 2,3-dioxygenase-like lactoylglutathione lyase family enzyme
MTIALDHMSIAAKDKVASANFYARLFGVTYEGLRRIYASVVVNEGLTLNFEDAESIERRHYAFRVSLEEFEAVRDRLAEAGVPYGSLDTDLNGTVYERGGRKGFYFNDLNGHGCEILTRV